MELYQIVTILSLLLGGFLLTGSRRRKIYILYKTLPRDIQAAIRFTKVNLLLWWWEKRGYTVSKVFSNYAATHPEKAAVIFEGKEWTYKELDQFSNRVGCYFLTKSLSRGDSVAIIMENRPEYVGIWLGLSKIGVVSALVNTNLRHDALLHSINVAKCKTIIFGSGLKDVIRDIKDKMPDIEFYQWSEETGTTVLEKAVDLNVEISNVDSGPLAELALGHPHDKLLYIYTSGTTGLPKAAIINNIRYMFIACGINMLLKMRSDDRVYASLPLYHTAGGILGIGQALVRGTTVVLRKKFSASNFWSDCVRYKCTVAQYIGEICRFLLTLPPSQHDTAHKIRLMVGNGLRPQIWKPFVKRFGIKQIGEIYGATEGNANLVNYNNTVGAVGFIPTFASGLYPVALMKANEETGELLRGPDGLGIRCKPGEPGIFVGRINTKKVVNNFLGYADEKASKKKILYDVFEKGDRVFNSGDLLVMDEFGYFYFKDRTGDTFRWRGENVSTSEVEAIISNEIRFKDAIVYGVEVPGAEGRAGMAAIYDSENTLNLKQLAEGVKKALPSYARPIFIRVLSKLPMTGTFKLKKNELRDEGFDITKIKDPIYFLNKDIYVRMTDEMYNDIVSGKMRL